MKRDETRRRRGEMRQGGGAGARRVEDRWETTRSRSREVEHGAEPPGSALFFSFQLPSIYLDTTPREG